jgi:hypothetical protein
MGILGGPGLETNSLVPISSKITEFGFLVRIQVKKPQLQIHAAIGCYRPK